MSIASEDYDNMPLRQQEYLASPTKVVGLSQERDTMLSDVVIPWSQVLRYEVVTPSVLSITVTINRYFGMTGNVRASESAGTSPSTSAQASTSASIPASPAADVPPPSDPTTATKKPYQFGDLTKGFIKSVAKTLKPSESSANTSRDAPSPDTKKPYQFGDMTKGFIKSVAQTINPSDRSSNAASVSSGPFAEHCKFGDSDKGEEIFRYF